MRNPITTDPTPSGKGLRWTLGTATCAALSFGLLTGLRPPQEPELTDGEIARLLQSRDREHEHPGDPLALVGIAEGQPSFLDGTPTLSGAALVVEGSARVRGAAYDRRLALYEGARFDTSVVGSAAPREASLDLPVAPPVEEKPASSQLAQVCAALALAVCAGAALWNRRRHAQAAAQRASH